MADEPGRSDAVPAPAPRAMVRLEVPYNAPEAVAWRTGRRLYAEGDDAVWVLIRSGQSLPQDLTQEELGAVMELGGSTWERWFALGWGRAASEEEGG